MVVGCFVCLVGVWVEARGGRVYRGRHKVRLVFYTEQQRSSHFPAVTQALPFAAVGHQPLIRTQHTRPPAPRIPVKHPPAVPDWRVEGRWVGRRGELTPPGTSYAIGDRRIVRALGAERETGDLDEARHLWRCCRRPYKSVGFHGLGTGGCSRPILDPSIAPRLATRGDHIRRRIGPSDNREDNMTLD